MIQFYSGLKISSGMMHPEFKNKGDKIIYNYPLVFISELPIEKVEDVLTLLDLAKRARKQLVVISHQIGQSVLGTMIYNKRKDILESTCLQIPDYGTKGK